MSSLCFLDAFRAKQKGNITEEEYIYHLFVHCQGVEHDGDDWTKEDRDLLKSDIFGYSVRAWSLRMDHVEKAAPFENVFTAYRTGDVEEVKASLKQLSDEHANYVRKSLAVLALQDRRSAILKLCFDQGGFAFEHYFEDAANRFQYASDDPETFKVLEGSKFRKLYPLSAPHAEGSSEEESEGEESDGEESDGEESEGGESEGGESEEEEDPSRVFDWGGRLPVDW